MPLLILSSSTVAEPASPSVALTAFTELQVIDIIYALYETDDTGWEVDSPEYNTARAYCNAAIQDWSSKTTWRDLWTTLEEADDGDKTIEVDTWDYNCPGNFSYPNSWVRTVSGGSSTFWKIIPNEMVAKQAGAAGRFCYITGSVRSGFVLHFNPMETLHVGATIDYEYYKSPTLYTGEDSKSEIPDPYYCVYYALARLLRNDGEDFSYEENLKREIIDNMMTTNMQGYWDIDHPIEESLTNGVGFAT